MGYNSDDDHCHEDDHSAFHDARDGQIYIYGDHPDEPYSSVEGHPPSHSQSQRGAGVNLPGGSGPRYSNGGGCLVFIVAGPALLILLTLTIL